MEQQRSSDSRILLVDDSRVNRILAKKLLEKAGYEVITAKDGEDAVQIFEHGPRPDLILMDISLPKIDGFEVTRRLKKQESFKDIPIIALTAHAMKGDREKAFAAGCDGYIPKPISVRELPDQIQTFFIQK